MSETENRVSFEITRFDPDRDEVPKQQTYEIPVEPDWKVLDAINYIKENPFLQMSDDIDRYEKIKKWKLYYNRRLFKS